VFASSFFIGWNLSGLKRCSDLFNLHPVSTLHLNGVQPLLLVPLRPNRKLAAGPLLFKTLRVDLAAFTTRSTDHQCLDDSNVRA
jgi:hypothetical protein